MDTKTKAGLIIIVMITSFSIGRFTGNKAEITTRTQESDTVKQNDNKDTKTTKVEVDKPDGTKTVTTTTEIVEHKTTVSNEIIKSSTDVIPPKANTLNVSALVGMDKLIPLYGISVTKQLVGPITVGGFGLTNGTLGVSIGVNF